MADEQASPIPSVPSTTADGDSHGNGEARTSTPKPSVETKPIYFASVAPGLDSPLLPAWDPLAKAVLDYEKAIGNPVWVILQSDTGALAFDDITDTLAETIIDCADSIDCGKKLTVVLHTSGGNPHAAYRLATFLQKRTGGFEVVVPKKAKSGGTLFVLGAMKIIMGQMAELGPLDMQVRDEESESWDSALNETKALQTLSREALVLYAEKMQVLQKLHRWKKFETRNRIATDFVNEMIRPLVEKIDAVHYTKMARIMEIMKKYGMSLMNRAGYPTVKNKKVVESLGEDFPDHSYIIDLRDAKDLGLRAESPRQELADLVETMAKSCGSGTVIGKISSSIPNGN